MKPLTILKNAQQEIISFILILLFVYTSASKILDWRSFDSALQKSPLLKTFAPVITWLIPITEGLVAALIYFRPTRLIGFYCSLTLLVFFTAYIGYMLLFIPNLPCTCGGVIQQLSWTQHFLFNILFIGICIRGIVLERRSFQTTIA